MRFGLAPLKRISEGLAAIRSGSAEQLEGAFPVEIAPLARETNALIDANTPADHPISRPSLDIGRSLGVGPGRHGMLGIVVHIDLDAQILLQLRGGEKDLHELARDIGRCQLTERG